MKMHRPTAETRADAWKNAAFYALAFAAVLLIVLKLFTPIIFGAALGVAIMAFLFGFAFAMRITPRTER